MPEAETFPSCRYGPNGEAQVFECADDVPEGWADHPSGPFKKAKEDAPKPDPLDHDGDGRKGGGPVPKRGRPKKAG